MTVRHIHGHSLFETSSSLTREQALGLSLHGSIEAKYDRVEHPHLDNGISRKKKDNKEGEISFQEAILILRINVNIRYWINYLT